MNGIILNTSQEAAKFVENTSGWVSRHGRFYGKDERAARWDGCTHVKCKDCGKQVPKSYLVCVDCHEKRAVARYDKLEKVEWDQEGLLYSDACGEFFRSWDEVAEFAEDHGVMMGGLRLVICEAVYLRGIDTDHWVDDMPDDWDGELPSDVMSAMNELNAAIKDAGPVSWRPGKKAVIL